MPKPNDGSATIRDIARRAGVSVATVSRVINRTGPVADETVARVQEAVAALHFTPRAAARHLATRRTNTLGLLLSDIHGDFFAPMLSGIEAVTREAGFDLLISTSARPAPREDLPGPLGPHNADGILVFSTSLGEAALRNYYAADFPMVLLHQTAPRGLEIPCVTVENKAASRRLVEHLIVEHGRRRILFLSGPRDNEDSHWRELGYLAALEAHGLPFDPALVAPGDFDRVVAQQTVASILSSGPAVDAIFAADDESAVGVYAALDAAGRSAGADLPVVGFDDQRFSAYLSPPLTTVRAPTEDVGRAAARQLVRRVRGEPVDFLTMLPTEVVIRRSCGCLPPRGLPG